MTALPLPQPNIPDDQNPRHYCVETSNLVLHGLRTPYEGTSYLYVNTNITAYRSFYTVCLYTRNTAVRMLTLCSDTIPRRIVLQEQVTVTQAVKIFPVFDGTSSRPARQRIYATP